ncbi:MAG: aminoglycoside phosphotransferase, partial [Umezawaea sp.]
GRMRALGGALAVLHHALADAFGVEPTGEADLAETLDLMRRRLDATAAGVPALGDHAGTLDAILTAVGRRAGRGSVQRVHGDLHLGQALHTPEGWLLIDFEGEPGTPVEHRRALDSPLRDVAGVLRSLDYAAGRVTPGNESAARRWAPASSRAFRDGYAEVAGQAPDPALLLAYQVDKAVYEVGYEHRNRPDWLPVPLRSIEVLRDTAWKAGLT